MNGNQLRIEIIKILKHIQSFSFLNKTSVVIDLHFQYLLYKIF